MGGWNCGGSDLNYPKIGIEILKLELQWRE